MKIGRLEITKEHFKSFLDVQVGGHFNAFDYRGIQATGLSKEMYQAIVEHYNELSKEYKGIYNDMLERTYDEKSR